jgi:cell wall assembly regulator SMI1
MTDDARQLSLDDLELSHRIVRFLGGLGIERLGQLLDRPRIALPEDWSLAAARLVTAELELLFEELGLEYAGEIVGPKPGEIELRATGDVAARWETIRGWIAERHPDAVDGFNPPATPAAIAEAEAALGHALPEDYKRFLLIHDGQDEFASFVGLGRLLSIAEVVETEIYGEPVPVDPSGVGEGVRALDYCPAWIPITESARGRDYLCIDLDPAPGGTRGQIIEYIVDFNDRPLVAPSFADLLSLYFEGIQTGEIDLDEDLDDEDVADEDVG